MADALRQRPPVVERYGGGGFVVGGTRFTGGVLVLPDAALGWDVRDCAGLSPDSLAPVIERAASIDLLLIGCGKAFGQVPPLVRQHLRNAGIAADAMDTRAAARTYSVLAGEGRRVAAALMPLA